MKNAYLMGTNVYLRPLESEDAATLKSWVNDPDVYRNLGTSRPMNLQAEESFVERSIKSEHDMVLGIVVRQSDRLVGSAGFHRIDFRSRHAMFGIMIGEKAEWDKGYGTEVTQLMVQHAFETMNLNRVWLQVYDFNPRAVHAYEKAGFRAEGVLRQDTFRDGRYWDSKVMAILREDWLAARKEHHAG